MIADAIVARASSDGYEAAVRDVTAETDRRAEALSPRRAGEQTGGVAAQTRRGDG